MQKKTSLLLMVGALSMIFGLGCKSPQPISMSLLEEGPFSKSLKDRLRWELSSSTVSNGSLALVKIYPNKPDQLEDLEKNLQLDFEGLNIPLFRAGESSSALIYGLLPIPYMRSSGKAQMVLSWKGSKQDSQVLTLGFDVVEGKYSSEVLKVQSQKVNPTRKEDVERIQKEVAQVGVIYRTVTPEKLWNGPFLLPIDSPVTSEYGTKRVYNGKFKNFHTGLDLRAAMNTPIYAPAAGKVVLAQDLFFTGNTVMVDHGFGLITLYAHMNELKVKKGDFLQPKQLIGLSGKTGRVNGPHLHWQSVIHGVKINPLGLTQVGMP